MASPQLEKGFVRLASEIYDALARYRIPGEARQALDFILRKTYGWNKKEDVISLSQFVLATNLKRPIVCRALNKLIHLNLIIKKDTPHGNLYRFNKDFESWTPLTKKITTKIMHSKSTGALSKKIMGSHKNDTRGPEKLAQILGRHYQK